MNTHPTLTDISPVTLPCGRVMDFFVAAELVHYIDNHRRELIELLADPDRLAFVRAEIMRPSRLTLEKPDPGVFIMPPAPGLQ